MTWASVRLLLLPLNPVSRTNVKAVGVAKCMAAATVTVVKRVFSGAVTQGLFLPPLSQQRLA